MAVSPKPAKSAASKERLSWGRFDDTVGPRIRLLINVLTTRSIASLSQFGMPRGSLTLLVLIEANSGCSQAALSRTTGLAKSALVGLLDELERRGFAARVRSHGDRRRNHLILTDEGRAQLETMYAVQIAQEKELFAAFTPAEHRQLVSLLDRATVAICDAE